MRGSGWVRIGATAFRWYLRAAREGVVRAQFNVGLCYRDGDGIKASKLKAANGFRRLLAADMLGRVKS